MTTRTVTIQGYTTITIARDVHSKLQYMKIRSKAKNLNEVIKELIRRKK